MQKTDLTDWWTKNRKIKTIKVLPRNKGAKEPRSQITKKKRKKKKAGPTRTVEKRKKAKTKLVYRREK